MLSKHFIFTMFNTTSARQQLDVTVAHGMTCASDQQTKPKARAEEREARFDNTSVMKSRLSVPMLFTSEGERLRSKTL